MRLKAILSLAVLIKNLIYLLGVSYSVSMDKSIKIWQVPELKLLKVIDKARHAGHGTSVNRSLWFENEGLLVTCSDDRLISVWNINFGL